MDHYKPLDVTALFQRISTFPIETGVFVSELGEHPITAVMASTRNAGSILFIFLFSILIALYALRGSFSRGSFDS